MVLAQWDMYYLQRDIETETKLRGELNYRIKSGLDFNTGLSIKMARLDYDNWFKMRPTNVYGYSLTPQESPSLITNNEYYNL